MKKSDQHIRDKQVTRYIHRMFLRAMFQRKRYAFFIMPLHVPYFFLLNVLIPLNVAYGIQAIVNKDIGAVQPYVIYILLISSTAAVLIFIVTWAFNRNGVQSAGQLQREV